MKPDLQTTRPRRSSKSYNNDIIINYHQQLINIPNAGAQACAMNEIGRLGHELPRGPSADWLSHGAISAAGRVSVDLISLPGRKATPKRRPRISPVAPQHASTRHLFT
ncbi:hypothetical protein evm_001083 [Chilo suppressalis]|nr:hypothetical protein evm_001083 [Chilo suppressalis]